VDPQTGTAAVMLPYFTHNVGQQSSIWVSNTGDLVINSGDYLLSAYQDFAAYSVLSLAPGGSANWDLFQGCCQYWAYAIDGAAGKGYYTSNGLYVLNLLTGTQVGGFAVQDQFGYPSIAAPTRMYVAGIGGNINQMDPSSTNTTSNFVPVATGQPFWPGAIAADGSFVVTAIGAGCNNLTYQCPGSLSRVIPGPTLQWTVQANTITPPVIGRQGYIFVGAQVAAATSSTPYQGALQAYDQSGKPVWSANVDAGLFVSDLILGNDGLVYAVAADAPYQTNSSQGELVAFDQATGARKLTITNLPGASQLILFNGVIYVTGQNLAAIPVAASGYDSQAPWPVRFHDNQRTANATSPQNLGNTVVADQTRDNSLYALTSASSNTFTGNITAASFIGNGSGLTGINATTAGTAFGVNCVGCLGNSTLANPSLTVTAGPGLSGGGSVPLGGTTTVSLASQSCSAGSAVTAHPFTCSPFATLGSNTFSGLQTMPFLVALGGSFNQGGILVNNSGGIGVYGQGTTSAAVFNYSGSASTGNILLGESNAATEFVVDAQGNVTANGNVAAGGSMTIGTGGTPIAELVSITESIAVPPLSPGTCTTFATAPVTGFTPGASDTIALGTPTNLVSGLFLMYQAWETTTTASPTITIQVCNPSATKYKGGATGKVRVDIFKH
jgi:hypothetical protein